MVELATSKGIFMADKSLPTVPSKVPSSSSSSVEALSSAASLRAASGRQPRGTKFPEMVPEFSETVMRTFDQTVWHEMNLAPGDKLSASAASAMGLAFVAKVLNVDVKVGSSRVDVLFGIFHTCEQFVSKAARLVHPFDSASSIQDDMLIAIFELLTTGPAAVERRREETFRVYEESANELEAAESDIHLQMDDNRAEIMSGKRFLLFKAMCKDAQVLDPDLMKHYVGGLSLTGEASVTGDFPQRRKAPSLTVEQAMKASSGPAGRLWEETPGQRIRNWRMRSVRPPGRKQARSGHKALSRRRSSLLCLDPCTW